MATSSPEVEMRRQCRYRVIGWSYGHINAGYSLFPEYLSDGTEAGRKEAEKLIQEAFASARRVLAEGFKSEHIYRDRFEAEDKAKELEDVTGLKWALVMCYAGDDRTHPDDEKEFIEPGDEAEPDDDVY
jgi:hypothetical protein